MPSLNSAICWKPLKDKLPENGENVCYEDLQSEMGNQQATLLELAWLAGIVDGEGSITMGVCNKRSAFTPRVTIANSDIRMVIKIVELALSLGCNVYVNKKGLSHMAKRDVWAVQINKFDSVVKFLEAVIPYMITKKEIAIAMVKFLKLRITKLHISCNNEGRKYTDDEIEIAMACRKLNSRGASTTNTQNTSYGVKIESELQGKLAELAEMTSRLRLGDRINKESKVYK